MTDPSPQNGLRRHQIAALEALRQAWLAGRRRCWVVMPPGAGKTRVGLEAAAGLLSSGQVDKVVVFSPNTAIQLQWLTQAQELGLTSGTDRALTRELTSLTYQSLAVFDPDQEVDDDLATPQRPLRERLHENGQQLIAKLSEGGRLLIILDECHHLLEAWGRLLEEVLKTLRSELVLSLTATPPTALSAEHLALVTSLFGTTTYESTIPAAVREGDLAPYAELVWLCSPSPVEADYLAEEAERFAALTTRITDVTFGSTPFLVCADARFCSPERPIDEIARTEPSLADAALRLHCAGLLAMPPGARLHERHRRPPTADDWVLLIEDWLLNCLQPTGDPANEQVIEAVRSALPSVGFIWTKRGIRRGRTSVDRVLARSAAKTQAVTAIIAAEASNLSDQLRMLVLCDHERATAMVPSELTGVLETQAGSARSVLAALLADPAASQERPLLVTAKTVAAAPETLAALRAHVAANDPALAARLNPTNCGDLTELSEGWTSRQWIGHVTSFFTAGGARVLVGTRGLLGEGWDARQISGLIDLTTATTATAVVQTRGRALRTDPSWPDKVAINWSVVCLAPEHPRGDNDWSRLVRKHIGYFGVGTSGDVVDGVSHLDESFSPYAPPSTNEVDAINARMLRRAENRNAIRERWRVGEPYRDQTAVALWVQPTFPQPERRSATLEPSQALEPPIKHDLVSLSPERGLVDRAGGTRPSWEETVPSAAGYLLITLASVLGYWTLTTATQPILLALVLAAAGALNLLVAQQRRRRRRLNYYNALLDEASRPVSVATLAHVVAQSLHEAGLTSTRDVLIEVEPDGQYRCFLASGPEEETALFAQALDESLSPIESARYLVPRWAPPPNSDANWVKRALRGPSPNLEVAEFWHPVPGVLATNAKLAKHFETAWQEWVMGGEVLYTGSAEGTGTLVAVRGSDPWSVTSVMRRQWR